MRPEACKGLPEFWNLGHDGCHDGYRDGDCRWRGGLQVDMAIIKSIITALIAFAFASFACSLSETISFFVMARFLLGLAGGIALPIGQLSALNQDPERYRTYGVGFLGNAEHGAFTLAIRN